MLGQFHSLATFSSGLSLALKVLLILLGIILFVETPLQQHFQNLPAPWQKNTDLLLLRVNWDDMSVVSKLHENVWGGDVSGRYCKETFAVFTMLSWSWTKYWMALPHLTNDRTLAHYKASTPVKMINAVYGIRSYLIIIKTRSPTFSSICGFDVNWVNLLWEQGIATLRSGDTVTNDRIERCCYC